MSKNIRRPKEDWSPTELSVDDAMKVIQHPGDDFVTCSIPWKTSPPLLENNLRAVENRQKGTNNPEKLKAMGTSIEQVNEIFQKQLDKGYIEEITDLEEINRPDSNYIAYFCVCRPDRTSTKVRIVFDAAAKAKNGHSLNSQILKGPNRLQDLFTNFLRFRKHDWALTADISEMFLQCRLDPEDRRYHRFWWNGKIYQWTRILFGNLSSPDISQKALTENAERNMGQYPLAAKAIMDAMYMDDILVSYETEEECIQSAKELPIVCSIIGMHLCKLQSCSIECMKTIPKELHAANVDLDKEEGSIFDPTKVLGIIWNPNTDSFHFKSKFSSIQEFLEKQKLVTQFAGWTKALILRLSMTVYDPSGLIAPFAVQSRKILQKLWQENLSWVDIIPQNYQTMWDNWLTQLFHHASLIHIPRSFGFARGKTYQLHVFNDASTTVFAAAVYIRVEDPREEEGSEGHVRSHLMTSKARVCPTKAESVSRLELCSAVIGHRLGYAVAIIYELDPKEIFFWTDSTNVLHWINTPANFLRTFVSNRVGQIQAHSEPIQWRHVPTDQNPADIATRDISLKDMVADTRWWKGPEWLIKPMSEWPPAFKPPTTEKDESVQSEYKKMFNPSADSFLVFKVIDTGDFLPGLDPTKFTVGQIYNGYRKLLNILIRIFRWRHCRKPVENHELEKKALNYLVLKAQRDDPDLATINDELTNDESPSKFPTLKPFIDVNGIVRSNGRVQNTHVPYDTRFPIILTTEMDFTKLLVTHYHNQYEHPVGREMAKIKLREKYFIQNLESLLMKTKSKCLYCIRKTNEPYSQQMAPIPEYRFAEPLHAFSKTGLDFAGPFFIKVGKKTRNRPAPRLKSYILVFTCLQTRAVHLEATYDQSTSSVMNAFSRFIDVRGMPQEFLSDNWSTFVSPDKEIQNWVRSLSEDLIIRKTCANATWHFTPPYGPHHGGIYETMVKASKRALKAIFYQGDLTMDEFRTAISRCASILNGRPLTRYKEEGLNLILTPNHFLHGNLSGAVSTKDLKNPVTRWQEVQALVDQYWKQFLESYIPLLNQRKSWQKERDNVEVGEIVLQLDPNRPRGQWELGVVVEVFRNDKDLKVRRCKIRTGTGALYVRPITGLVPLEIKTFESPLPINPVQKRTVITGPEVTEDTEGQAKRFSSRLASMRK